MYFMGNYYMDKTGMLTALVSALVQFCVWDPMHKLTCAGERKNTYI